jgi:prophage regulatory protein
MANNIHSISNQEPDKTSLPDRLLRWDQVQPRVGICRSHAHSLAAQNPPQFPRPRKLVPGGRASAWVESEINAWVQQRIADTQPDSSDIA